MSFLQDKKIRTLILVMSVLAAIGFLIAKTYYKSVNASFDPRVATARELYSEYNLLAEQNDFEEIFILLDSIEAVYQNIPHYANSYEIGVLSNNKAAALLTMAMHKDSLLISSKYFNAFSADTLFSMGELAVKKSISIYENWFEVYRDKSREEIDALLKKDFFLGLEAYSQTDIDKYLASREEEIVTAQFENMRRLSVSYTNLGMIYRNYKNYEAAIKEYERAIDLWDRNLVAQNNLNILLGRPLVKQNIIQKLFPPEKDAVKTKD